MWFQNAPAAHFETTKLKTLTEECMTDNGNGDKSQAFGPIFQAVVQFFEDDGWPYEQIEDEAILRLEYEGENGKWRCYANVIEERQRFLFLSSLANYRAEADAPGSLRIPDPRQFRHGSGQL